MTYPCYLDYHSEWAHQTGVSLRPSFLVIGRDGKVVTRITAALFQSGPEFQQLADAIEQSLAVH